jgi:hypothetical protein
VLDVCLQTTFSVQRLAFPPREYHRTQAFQSNRYFTDGAFGSCPSFLTAALYSTRWAKRTTIWIRLVPLWRTADLAGGDMSRSCMPRHRAGRRASRCTHFFCSSDSSGWPAGAPAGSTSSSASEGQSSNLMSVVPKG